MKLTLQNLRQGPGDETPEFEALLLADGVEAAVVKSDGRGGSAILHWLHRSEDEGAPAIDRKAVLAEVVKRVLKSEKDPAVARMLKQYPEEALLFLPEVIPVGKKSAAGRSVQAREDDKELNQILGALFGELKRSKQVQSALLGVAADVVEDIDCEEVMDLDVDPDGSRVIKLNPEVEMERVYEAREGKWADTFSKVDPKVRKLVQQYLTRSTLVYGDSERDSKERLEEAIAETFFDRILPSEIDGDKLEDVYDDIRFNCADSESYSRDPYAYYGVSRRDFMASAKRVATRFQTRSVPSALAVATAYSKNHGSR